MPEIGLLGRQLPAPDRVLRVSSIAVLFAMLGSGLLMSVVGIDLVDHLAWGPACAFRALTGLDCPGCGMTRALVLLGQLKFAASWSAHPVAPALVVALALGAARPAWLAGRSKDAVAGIGLVLLAFTWSVR